MPPGTEQAIQAAAATGRWEAVALLMIMLVVVALLAWLVKAWITQAAHRDVAAIAAAAGREQQALEREEALAKRIDSLEEYTRNTLQGLVRECTQALLQHSISQAESTRILAGLMEQLNTTRVCFASGEKQTQLVETIAERVADRARQIDVTR
jgi:hypothetical protein